MVRTPGCVSCVGLTILLLTGHPHDVKGTNELPVQLPVIQCSHSHIALRQVPVLCRVVQQEILCSHRRGRRGGGEIEKKKQHTRTSISDFQQPSSLTILFIIGDAHDVHGVNELPVQVCIVHARHRHVALGQVTIAAHIVQQELLCKIAAANTRTCNEKQHNLLTYS